MNKGDEAKARGFLYQARRIQMDIVMERYASAVRCHILQTLKLNAVWKDSRWTGIRFLPCQGSIVKKARTFNLLC